MKRIGLAVTVLMLAVGLLSGCSEKQKEGTKSAASSPSAKLIEPSSLLSKEEAKALTGIDFNKATTKEESRVGLKMYLYENDNNILQVGISQVAFMDSKTSAAGNTPPVIYKNIKSGFKDAPKIEGLGDDNFLIPTALYILRGEYYVTVVSNPPISRDKEKMKAIGLKVVENLDRLTRK
ncbi:MAG TPA: hypothetical protein PLN25_12185 [Deltaproteobacteria bacterium]|nr:hypothetical protein [Deltaproteobacteria bacterium]